MTLLFNRSAWLVVTDTQPATNLRVVQSTLQEGTTGAHLSPSYLTLCAAGRCSEGVKVGRGASPVEVVIDSSFRHNGEFTGNLLLASDENPAGFAPFELKVLSTTRGTRATGAALILAGIPGRGAGDDRSSPPHATAAGTASGEAAAGADRPA